MSRIIGNYLINFMEKMFMHLKPQLCKLQVEKKVFLVESREIFVNTTLDVYFHVPKNVR